MQTNSQRDAYKRPEWRNDFRHACRYLHLRRLTLRLSCGARAPQRFRPRPPARRLLQPVVRPRVTPLWGYALVDRCVDAFNATGARLIDCEMSGLMVNMYSIAA